MSVRQPSSGRAHDGLPDGEDAALHPSEAKRMESSAADNHGEHLEHGTPIPAPSVAKQLPLAQPPAPASPLLRTGVSREPLSHDPEAPARSLQQTRAPNPRQQARKNVPLREQPSPRSSTAHEPRAENETSSEIVSKPVKIPIQMLVSRPAPESSRVDGPAPSPLTILQQLKEGEWQVHFSRHESARHAYCLHLA